MGQEDARRYAAGTVLLGRYLVEATIGSGGMGTILRVTNLKLGERRALKLLSQEVAAIPGVAARFHQEAQAALKLRSEHVVHVFDVDALPDGTPCIELEFLEGHDLAREIERRGALSPGEAVDYVLQACDALAEAHAHGIVHRDLKPANLFLTRRYDATTLVKVIDFGIAKWAYAPNGLTTAGMVLGTPGYMAPEQIGTAGDVGVQADIWALGAVLYQCVSGHGPFVGDSAQALQHMTLTAEPTAMNPCVPSGLRAVILTCLEKHPEKRFPLIATLAAALVPFAGDRRAAEMTCERAARVAPAAGPLDLQAIQRRGPDATTVHSGERAPPTLPRPRSRRRVAISVAVAIAVALGGGIIGRRMTSANRDVDAGSRDGSMALAQLDARRGESPPADATAVDAPAVDARVADATAVDARVADAGVVDAAQTDCTAATINQRIADAKADRDRGAWQSGQVAIERVLSCKRSVAYVELAAELACGARDEVRARRYFLELPSTVTNPLGQSRRARVKKQCRRNGIDLP